VKALQQQRLAYPATVDIGFLHHELVQPIIIQAIEQTIHRQGRCAVVAAQEYVGDVCLRGQCVCGPLMTSTGIASACASSPSSCEPHPTTGTGGATQGKC